ncbi:redoxin domain-containing protein [Cellulomonas sp. NPDC089187]|uniref:redoxin domain-containing protein n=1 Tax=Cellulomonas sp. NPDC089187 TaxID=3154970 RepID=UPI003419A8BA
MSDRDVSDDTPGMLAVGNSTPSVQLTEHTGRPVTLGGPGGRPTLVVFVPFAFSPVCGDELARLNTVLPELRERVDVCAVSCDPVPTLRAWAERESFDFPLLSDFWPHGAAARAFGVLDEEQGYARRGSFLLDTEGVMRWRTLSPAGVGRDPEVYLQAAASLPSVGSVDFR